MAPRRPNLTTIGYEAASPEDLVATLLAAEVRLVIDVRELPISRRRGFAKVALSTSLAQAGVDYVHLRGLGDPKPGREAARRGDHVGMAEIFTRHMATMPAQVDLSIASKLASKGGACLLCFERDHATCHRTIVAAAISATVPVSIRHIGVKHGLVVANATKFICEPAE